MSTEQLRAWAESAAALTPDLTAVVLAVRRVLREHDAALARCKAVLDREAAVVRHEIELEHLRAEKDTLAREVARLRAELGRSHPAPWEKEV